MLGIVLGNFFFNFKTSKQTSNCKNEGQSYSEHVVGKQDRASNVTRSKVDTHQQNKILL